MNLLTKWTFIFAIFILSTDLSHAWNIASLGRVNGPSIHSTYFLTPNNASYQIRAYTYVGQYVNGTCQYKASYDLGTEQVKTGDVVDIDAFRLKSLIGMGYSCMTIFYTNKQVVMDTIQLNSDGINYTNSFPGTSEVSIL